MIHYIKGDATEPIGEGRKLIVHICNDIGAWGAGFTGALDNKWEIVGNFYRDWFENENGHFEPMVLGDIQIIIAESDIQVCNMIAQCGVRTRNNTKPIDYKALRKCLERVSDHLLLDSIGFDLPTIHMPRIGTGLAGGKWELIEPIIEEELSDFDVYVYTLEVA